MTRPGSTVDFGPLRYLDAVGITQVLDDPVAQNDGLAGSGGAARSIDHPRICQDDDGSVDANKGTRLG
jgi:hypothetical protein